MTLQPATTPPIVGTGSIASLESVQIGGHEQWLLIRARTPDTPVLLYLSGVPGETTLPFTRVL